MHAAFSSILLFVIVGLSILLMLIRPRNLPEVYWVGSGAVLLVLLRLIPLRTAAHAVAEGLDVYLFLTGMMLLSELARENGVFDWLAAIAVDHARGSCLRLFGLVYLVGTAVTICLSNDATAVVLTPAILTALDHADLDGNGTKALPYLFACAMIANAASFVLPISNPANLVVFHHGLPTLGHWLESFLLPSLSSVVVTFCVLRLYFRRELAGGFKSQSSSASLHAEGKLVVAGLAVIVAVLLTCSAFDVPLGLPTCLAALAITAVVCLKRSASPWPLVREISWSTLALVAALFVLVDAVESRGALHVAQTALLWAATLPHAFGPLLTGVTVGVANNLVNNLPLGLIAGATVQAAHVHGLVTNAVLIGVDLGPNLSVTGSLATILWLIALRREKLNVSGFDFLKAGALAMPAALLASLGTIIAVHALLGLQ